jgi:hypothetical protein
MLKSPKSLPAAESADRVAAPDETKAAAEVPEGYITRNEVLCLIRSIADIAPSKSGTGFAGLVQGLAEGFFAIYEKMNIVHLMRNASSIDEAHKSLNLYRNIQTFLETYRRSFQEVKIIDTVFRGLQYAAWGECDLGDLLMWGREAAEALPFDASIIRWTTYSEWPKIWEAHTALLKRIKGEPPEASL